MKFALKICTNIFIESGRNLKKLYASKLLSYTLIATGVSCFVVYLDEPDSFQRIYVDLKHWLTIPGEINTQDLGEILFKKSLLASILERIEAIAILSASLFFLLEAPSRHKRKIYDALQVIASNAGQPGNLGRREALADLTSNSIVLDGLDLSGANLIGANLYRGQFERSNFQSTDLRYVNLKKANLKLADLRNADLRYANLSEANLEEANLGNKLTEVDAPEWARLTHDNLNTSLKGIGFEHARARGNTQRILQFFEDENELDSANLKDVDLSKANLKGSNLKGVFLNEARLEEADLSHSFLIQVNFSDASLIGANLCGSNIRKSHFYKTNFQKSNLSG